MYKTQDQQFRFAQVYIQTSHTEVSWKIIDNFGFIVGVSKTQKQLILMSFEWFML